MFFYMKGGLKNGLIANLFQLYQIEPILDLYNNSGIKKNQP